MKRFADEVPEEASTTLVRARAVAAKILGRIRPRGPAPSPLASHINLLSEGEVVAERYRVLRLIERGGVGQVYLVEDLELGGRVALKTLRPRLADSPEAIDQFKREIFLARRVTHENVCRLFDLGRHLAADPGHERLYFVTMELLDGETLRDRIRRRGRLGLDESLEIARQVALGIRAAHRQGVIHRDIKGSNVMLVEQPDGSTRAVVTDFGLALQAPSAEAEAEAGDGAGEPLPSRLEGTPLFMAPEQVVGEAVTEAADIYSFGVLLYHMVTGAWPFEGATAVSTALARIEQEPVPPSRHLANLDPRLEAIILRCLERQPGARFESIGSLLTAIEEIRGLRGPKPKERQRGQRRWPLLTAIVILALAVLALGWLARPRAVVVEGERPLPALEMRPSLALVPFSAVGEYSQSEGLGVALSEGIAALLAAGEGLRVVNVDQREELRAELRAGFDSRSMFAEIEQIGATWMLRGSVRLPDDDQDRTFFLDLRLESRQEEQAVHSFSFAGTSDQLGDLIDRAGAEVREALQLASPTALQIDSARAEMPGQTQAALLYAQGLAALRRFDAVAARGKLEAALEREPDHPLVLSALAEVMARLGYQQHSAQIAEQAMRYAGGLSREKQLAVEARFRLTTHEWERAEELFRALHEFFPDDLEYGLNLASVQNRASRLEAAFATVDRLRQLPPPWGTDPRLDLTEAKTAYQSGDFPRSQVAAGRAVAAARSSGSRLLLARALDHEALTRVDTDGDVGRVEALLGEALALYRQVDHKGGETEALLNLSQHARQRNELDQAAAYGRQGLALAAETGNLAAQARGMNQIAILHDLRGKLKEGLALKMLVLENLRQRDVRQGAAVTMENIGISLLKMGRPVEALEQFLQAAEQFAQLGDQIGVAWSPYHTGRVWLDLGDLEAAGNSFERARRAAVAHPEGGLADATELELIRISATRGDGAEAEQRARVLVELFESQDQRWQAAEARLLLAQILASRDQSSQARKLAAEVLAFSDLEGINYTATEAQLILTQGGLVDHLHGLGDLLALDEVCHDLEVRVSGLEHRKIALLAQVVLLRCSLAGGSAPVELVAEARAIVAEAVVLRLAEPRREAACLEAEILAAMGGASSETLSLAPCVGVGEQVSSAVAGAASDS